VSYLKWQLRRQRQELWTSQPRAVRAARLLWAAAALCGIASRLLVAERASLLVYGIPAMAAFWLLVVGALILGVRKLRAWVNEVSK
jgi:hypothetical protein